MRAMVVAGLMCVAGAAGASDGVLIRCGASSGHAYFFRDELMHPDGPSWEKDGMSAGKIILVKLGEEWDIQFDDSVGSYGYRADGARVFPLGFSDTHIMVGAFAEGYADIYSFDMATREVAWTSSKLGPLIPKAAVYHAKCE